MTTTQAPAGLPRLSPRADIQGLRAVAVALVVLAHAGVPGLAGGFVGVDVFFVVSGFLISSLLLHEATTTGRLRVGMFYARRARRILPAAVLVLVATVVWAAPRASVARVADLVDDVRWSALFAANVHFSRLGTDYFEQDRAVSPVQHFWSLAVEEQFYLVWPALIVLLLALPARHRVRAAVVVVAAAWTVSLAWSLVLTERSPVSAYFSSTTRSWELATGTLLALAGNQLARVPRAARLALSTVGPVLVVTAATTFDGTTPIPGWRALLPVLGTAAVLAAGTRGPVGPARLLTVGPVRYVGDISYSLYLWHWPVLVLGAGHVGREPDRMPTVGLVALTMGLSVLSFHLVEQPVRRARGPVLRGHRALTLWPVTLTVAFLAGGWANTYAQDALDERIEAASAGAPSAGRSPPARGVLDEAPATEAGRGSRPRRRPADQAAAAPSVGDRIRAALQLTDRRAPIPFPLANYRHLRDDIWMDRFPCYASWGDPVSRVCPTGDLHARRTVVVYGDSHAGMWLPPVSALGKRDGYRVVPLVKVGCAPFDVAQLGQGAPFPDCDAFRAWAERRIGSLHPDTILLAYRGLWAVAPRPGETPVDVWTAGVSSSVRRLVRLTPTVKVIGDITALDYSPADCLTEPHATMASCTQAVRPVTSVANATTRRAAQGNGAEYVDVAHLVCLHRRCPLVVDQVVTYRDNAHITVTWSQLVADELGRALGLSEPHRP